MTRSSLSSPACSTVSPLASKIQTPLRQTYLPDDSSSIPPMGHDRFIRQSESVTNARAAAQKRAQA